MCESPNDVLVLGVMFDPYQIVFSKIINKDVVHSTSNMGLIKGVG